MLRAMLAHLDDDTVDVASMVLGLVNPVLADPACGRCACGDRIARLMHCSCRGAETDRVRRQLQQLLHDRQAAVEMEIRREARLAVAAADRVATAEQQRTVAEQVAADTRTRQRLVDADAFAVHVADVEVAAARRAVIERLTHWEQTRVRIWQAQGVLASQCAVCR